MICSACDGELLYGEEYLQCVINSCGKVYHYLCNSKNMSLDERNVWICPECQCMDKRGDDNDNTPAGTPIVLSNITTRKVIDSNINSNIGNFKVTPQMESSLFDQISAVRSMLDKIMISLTTCHLKLDENKEVLSTMDERMKKVENELQAVRLPHASPAVADESVAREIIIEESGDGCDAPVFHSIPASTKRRTDVPVLKTSIPVSNSNVMSRASYSAPPLPIIPEKTIAPIVASSPVLVQFNPQASLVHSSVSSGEVKRPVLASTIPKLKTNGKTYNNHQPLIICGTAGPEMTTLRAVDRRRYLHLWNMQSEADDVRAYLLSLCPEGNCSVEELKPRGNYKSFKIGIVEAFCDKCLRSDVWPCNAKIKEWKFFRPHRKNAPGKSGSSPSVA